MSATTRTDKRSDVQRLPDLRASSAFRTAPQSPPAPVVVTVVIAIVLGLGVAVAAVLVTAFRLPAEASVPTTVMMLPAQPDQRPLVNAAAAPVAAPAAVPAPIGNWTAERGRQIAERALAWLSWPYSFGGGNASGPTYGFPVDHDSRNDGKIRGFDCSGLVIFAVAPWMNVSHSAAAQYTEAGSVHPSLDSLQPGDLIFWSPDGTVQGIGHVAVYIGDGKVVQAPRSGAYIVVTPINQVEPGSIGVTRPLT